MADGVTIAEEVWLNRFDSQKFSNADAYRAAGRAKCESRQQKRNQVIGYRVAKQLAITREVAPVVLFRATGFEDEFVH